MNAMSLPETPSASDLDSLRDARILNWMSHEGIFENRTASAAARQLAIVLASAVEEHLALLESMRRKISTTKADMEHQQALCDHLVAQCADLGIGTAGLRGRNCLRLAARLQALRPVDAVNAATRDDNASMNPRERA